MKNVLISKNFLLAVILVTGALLLWSLSGFLTGLLSCLIMYVLLKVPFRYLTEKKKMNATLATSLLLLMTFVVVLVPIWILYQLLASKIYYAIEHSGQIMAMVQQADDYLFAKTSVRFLSTQSIQKMQALVASFIPSLLGQTADLLANIGLMYFLLYYLLKNTGKNEAFLNDILPVKKENARRFANELEMQVYSNVLGAPLLAIIQGISAGICFWACGLDEPWFWGTINGFMSFVPMVGTAVIWLPVSLYFFAQGHTYQGTFVLAYGVIIITNIDNVFRFAFQRKIADVHPLITVLGVITGLNWFGLPGIIFGPLLFSYFVLLIKMYWEDEV